MNDLASEFFYDAIARIPSGLLIIIMYWRKELENVYYTHRELFSSPVIFMVCLLGLAWLIGCVVEAIVYGLPVILICLRRKLFRGLNKTFIAKFESNLLVKQDPIGCESNAGDENFRREKRRQGYFAVALKIMARDLSVLLLIVGCHLPEPFSNLHWCRWYGLIGCISFAAMWLFLKGFFASSTRVMGKMG